jgi:hypothetical protein
MDFRTQQTPPNSSRLAATAKRANFLTSALLAAFAVIGLTTVLQAAELPNAPSSYVSTSSSTSASTSTASEVKATFSTGKIEQSKVIDKKFVSLALISAGSTFADSYTTLFARENWLARKQGVCNVETQSPYLYGTHPTVARAYAVASAKSAGSALAAYYMRKHHSRFWSAPLVVNSVMSLEGVTQNMIACN